MIHSPCHILQFSSLLSVLWVDTMETIMYHAITAQEQPHQQGVAVMTQHFGGFLHTSFFLIKVFRTMNIQDIT